MIIKPIMQKAFFRILFLSIVPCILLNNAVAIAIDYPEYWKVINIKANDYLSIRSKPSAKARRVGKIPHYGRCIHHLDYFISGEMRCTFRALTCPDWTKTLTSDWAIVRYKKVAGWVSAKYLAEDSEKNCVDK